MRTGQARNVRQGPEGMLASRFVGDEPAPVKHSIVQISSIPLLRRPHDHRRCDRTIFNRVHDLLGPIYSTRRITLVSVPYDRGALDHGVVVVLGRRT